MRSLCGAVALVALAACATTHGDDDFTGDDDDFNPFVDAGDDQADSGFVTQADACVPGWHDLLKDPGFDSGGTDWTQDPVVVGALTPAPDSAPNAAYMGGGNSQVQELSQAVQVPADATMLRVTGKLFISSGEDNTSMVAYDRLNVELFSDQGALLEHIGATPTYSNLDVNNAFTPFEHVFADPAAGKQVRIAFLVRTDGSISTQFVLDSLTLEAFGCGP